MPYHQSAERHIPSATCRTAFYKKHNVVSSYEMPAGFSVKENMFRSMFQSIDDEEFRSAHWAHHASVVEAISLIYDSTRKGVC
jgi:hypothetical protein